MLPFSDEELLLPVKNSLDKQSYILENDGGSLKLLGVKDGVVYVQLLGACHGCAASGTTLKYALEAALQRDIHPDLIIQNLPNGEEDFDKL